MAKKIDIIIPAYKAHNTIFKTLCSIAEQVNTEDILVTIVNDCCPEGNYKEFIKKFKGQLDIQEIKTPKNGGPGVARQYGIDNTSCEYIMFIDADDVFINCFIIKNFLEGAEDRQLDFMASHFVEERDDGVLMPHDYDTVWMFGKIYRRKFLEEYNIRFTDARANEDSCFNQKVLLILRNQDKQIPYLENYSYVWKYKEKSITRVNNCQYRYDQSVLGYIDGMIDVFDWAEKQNIKKSLMEEKAMSIIFNLYVCYCDVGSSDETFQFQNFEFIKKFYHKVWKKMQLNYQSKEFIDAFQEGMMDLHEDGRTPYIIFMAQPNIVQFMDMLENSPYKEEDIYQVWEKLPEEFKQNNIGCGVVSPNYYKKY